MKHGYTNATTSDGRTVEKRYLGPDAASRQQNEVAALTAVGGLVPVPPLLGQTESHCCQNWMRPHPGTVLVHGDFGPQNMLFDESTNEPTAVLDWELAHIGDPVEDLAWTEWIVRTHHAQILAALPALFVGYGEQPPWSRRHAAMMEKCHWALDFVRRWPAPAPRAPSSGSDASPPRRGITNSPETSA